MAVRNKGPVSKSGKRASAATAGVRGTITDVYADLETARKKGTKANKVEIKRHWPTCGPLQVKPIAYQAKPAASPFSVGDVKPAGELKRRLDLNLRHLNKMKSKLHAALPGWGANNQGLLLWNLGRLAPFYPEVAAQLRPLLGHLRAHPNPKGQSLFYTDSNLMYPDAHDWFGNDVALLGLLTWYRHMADDSVLDMIGALADHFDERLPLHLLHSGMAGQSDFIHQIDAFSQLHALTGRSRYLKRAQRLASMFKPATGTQVQWVRLHQQVATASGLLELYRITSQKRYLQQSQAIHENTLNNWLWVTGGIYEGNFNCDEHNDEYCGIAEWIRLNLNLADWTSDPRYYDIAEHAWRNHHGFDQEHGGGFVSIRSLVNKQNDRGSVCWFCCSMKAPRAITDIIEHIYSRRGKAIQWNLLCDSTAKITISGTPVTFVQKTGRNPAAEARLTMRLAKPVRFKLSVRIPEWTQGHVLKLNGKRVNAKVHNGYATTDRIWRDTDRLQVNFDCGFRLIPSGHNPFTCDTNTPLDLKNLERAALMYGPYVLMLDKFANPDLSFDSLVLGLPAAINGHIDLPLKPLPAAERTAFSIPAAHVQVRACNAAGTCPRSWPSKSKGPSNPMTCRAGAARAVTLRPVSEMTGHKITKNGMYNVRLRWLPDIVDMAKRS